jgi:hypothetical protein
MDVRIEMLGTDSSILPATFYSLLLQLFKERGSKGAMKTWRGPMSHVTSVISVFQGLKEVNSQGDDI